MSRQAAWERFHEEAHAFRRRGKSEARALRDRHPKDWDEFKGAVRNQVKTHQRPSH